MGAQRLLRERVTGDPPQSCEQGDRRLLLPQGAQRLQRRLRARRQQRLGDIGLLGERGAGLRLHAGSQQPVGHDGGHDGGHEHGADCHDGDPTGQPLHVRPFTPGSSTA